MKKHRITAEQKAPELNNTLRLSSMQEIKHILDCYDKTALNYAATYINELDNKHLDKILLKAFINANSAKGQLIDLGCGPGQTTKFLSDNGFTNLVGTDFSGQMVQVARQTNPNLQFEQADILHLKFPDNKFGSAIAFYSIVHFDYAHVRIAFQEVNRVLADQGEFLFAFHVGDNIVHLTRFLDHPVEIDFHFFETGKIKNILEDTGFDIVDIIVRQPYKDIEHPSERAYIWAKKNRR